VLIVAERGDVRLVPPVDDLGEDEKAVDVRAIAASMYPEAKVRVSIFASDRVDGWTCLLPSESWNEGPSK
jgi:hypothetical protein